MTASTLPNFTPLEDSLFLTLAGRALDSRSERSLLHDTTAEAIVQRLGYDATRFHLSTSPILGIAHRSKKLDQLTERFIDAHQDAVVLDLGVGLDTRHARVAPPESVDWYDVDFPSVITARTQLIPATTHTHNIAADVTDPAWLEGIPTGRPAMIIADGLMAFLSQDDMIALLDRLTAHFPSGEIAFNGYTRFAIWAAKHYHGTQSVAGLIKSPGFDDPHQPERWNPKLRLVREICLDREPEVAQFPPILRAINRLAAHSTAVSRRGTTVLHYAF